MSPRAHAARYNAMSEEEAVAAFVRCGGSTRWAKAMAARRPFADDVTLHAAADATWALLGEADILEAVNHHPRLGADPAALRARFANTAAWSSTEQAQVAAADEATLTRLHAGNVAYEDRFSHTFIVCASGKPAAEILALLSERLANTPAQELAITSGELRKILHLRLDK